MPNNQPNQNVPRKPPQQPGREEELSLQPDLETREHETRHQNTRTPQKGGDSQAAHPVRDDDDSPTGIADAARKGQTFSEGEDDPDLGNENCGCDDDKPE